MGEGSKQVKQHIEETRNELGRNIDTLQNKVKDSFDWRAQFEERPMTMISLAFGAGVLLASFTGGGSRKWRSSGDGRRSSSPNAAKAAETWDKIKGALVGVAATKSREYLDGILPGFEQEYAKADGEKSEVSSSGEIARAARA